MPYVFLKPLTYDNNRFSGGGTEEYYMNLIVDYMIPILRANDIQFSRSPSSESLDESIKSANEKGVDLYLSLNSARSTSSSPGVRSGINIYYDQDNPNAKKAAEIFSNALKSIYVNPDNVRTIPTKELKEVTEVKAPSVSLEIAYADDYQDAIWLRNNLYKIAETLVKAITQIYGINFMYPKPSRTGIVKTQSGPLNIRALPSTSAEILSQVPRDTEVEVLGSFDGWYIVVYNGVEGYSKSEYINVE